MKIKKIIFTIAIFILAILINNICFAKDIDQINKYYITVDPREDGTLDMSYHIEWEVLEDTSAGPLTWVQIGIPNKNVDSIEAISNNIKKIQYSSDNGAYILIDFKKEYNKGDIVTFDFSFHQKYMYTLDSTYCKYSFTPGWFDEIEVKDLKVYWKAQNVQVSNADQTNTDNYLVWSSKLAKGAKLKTEVKYYKTAFDSLNEYHQSSYANYGAGSSADYMGDTMNGIIPVFIIIIILLCIVSPFLGGGYNRHRGYGYGYRRDYDDDYYYHRPHRSYRSSCASSRSCVSSCACACACAGGGRAGCSKKDFYGTNLRTKNINKILKK